ncbi:hypothetical protein C8Q74DRAFT_1221370 [Fomes fomentarius]|nr:hypothetical protein C8Q74DRAFT_1221370 [Fomes fomentarius]
MASQRQRVNSEPSALSRIASKLKLNGSWGPVSVYFISYGSLPLHESIYRPALASNHHASPVAYLCGSLNINVRDQNLTSSADLNVSADPGHRMDQYDSLRSSQTELLPHIQAMILTIVKNPFEPQRWTNDLALFKIYILYSRTTRSIKVAECITPRCGLIGSQGVFPAAEVHKPAFNIFRHMHVMSARIASRLLNPPRPLVTQCAALFGLFVLDDTLAQQAFDKKGTNHDLQQSPLPPMSPAASRREPSNQLSRVILRAIMPQDLDHSTRSISRLASVVIPLYLHSSSCYMASVMLRTMDETSDNVS